MPLNKNYWRSIQDNWGEFPNEGKPVYLLIDPSVLTGSSADEPCVVLVKSSWDNNRNPILLWELLNEEDREISSYPYLDGNSWNAIAWRYAEVTAE